MRRLRHARRSLRDYSDEEAHASAERMRAAYERADREAAPLLALQWAEAELVERGLLTLAPGETLVGLAPSGDGAVFASVFRHPTRAPDSVSDQAVPESSLVNDVATQLTASWGFSSSETVGKRRGQLEWLSFASEPPYPSGPQAGATIATPEGHSPLLVTAPPELRPSGALQFMVTVAEDDLATLGGREWCLEDGRGTRVFVFFLGPDGLCRVEPDRLLLSHGVPLVPPFRIALP